MVGGDAAVIDRVRPVLERAAARWCTSVRPVPAPRRRSPSTACCTRSAPRWPSAWSRPAAEGVSTDALFDVLAVGVLVEPVPGLQAAVLRRPGQHPGRLRPPHRDQGPRSRLKASRTRACRRRSSSAPSSCTSRRCADGFGDRDMAAMAAWFAATPEPTGLGDDRRLPAGQPERTLTWESTRTERTQVDWEQRLDFDRLRTERLARLRAELEALVARSGPRVRLQQHPLHDGHPHRHVGGRQADPLLAPGPRRRADHLGLRLGGPPVTTSSTTRGSTTRLRSRRTPCTARTTARPRPGDRRPRRHLHPARGLPPGRRHRRGGRPQDQGGAGEARPAQRAPGSRRHRAADPAGAAAGRHRRSSTVSRSSSRRAGSRPRTRSGC